MIIYMVSLGQKLFQVSILQKLVNFFLQSFACFHSMTNISKGSTIFGVIFLGWIHHHFAYPLDVFISFQEINQLSKGDVNVKMFTWIGFVSIFSSRTTPFILLIVLNILVLLFIHHRIFCITFLIYSDMFQLQFLLNMNILLSSPQY